MDSNVACICTADMNLLLETQSSARPMIWPLQKSALLDGLRQ